MDTKFSHLLCDGKQSRGGSKTAATPKMKRFVTKVNSFQSLTIITKRSILDVAAVLVPPLAEYRAQKEPSSPFEGYGNNGESFIIKLDLKALVSLRTSIA